MGIGLAQQLGPRWVGRRMKHSAKVRSGYYRRSLPVHAWSDRTLCIAPHIRHPDSYLAYRRTEPAAFLFSSTDRQKFRELLRNFDSLSGTIADTQAPFPLPVVGAEVQDILEGKFRYFSLHRFDRGVEPNWHCEPWYGTEADPQQHWSAPNPPGDIKLIWELSRFSWVFPLVRSYWRTSEEVYAERFWRLVESWQRSNQPNAGVNWQCGQEASFRIMALAFGLYGFLDADVTTGERLLALAAIAEFSAERIEVTLDYALNQCNNHGISEGVGLLTIGLLFPELASASRWRKIGRSVIEAQVEALIYADGSFSQHSLNYQRVLLDDMIWAHQLCEKSGKPLSAQFEDRLTLAALWLRRMVVTSDGSAFNVGRNDGASVLPLSNSWYWDYRPAAGASLRCVGIDPELGDGPWDEKSLWFLGAHYSTAGLRQVPSARGGDAAASDNFDNSTGHVTLRSESARAVAYVRAPSMLTHRPSEADLFHVGVALDGRMVAIDVGSFSYNAPTPWNAPFATEAHHNVARLVGAPLMKPAGKFNFLPWPRLECQVAADSRSANIQHRDNRSGVHRSRSVAIERDDTVVIVDRFQLPNSRPAILRWSLSGALRWSAVADGVVAERGTSREIYLRFGAGVVRNGVWEEAECDIEAKCFASDNERPDPHDPRDWAAVGYRTLVPSPWIEVACEVPADGFQFWTCLTSNRDYKPTIVAHVLDESNEIWPDR